MTFTGPFKFDIGGYVQNVRDKAWTEATKLREIQSVPRICDQVAQSIDSAAVSTGKVEDEGEWKSPEGPTRDQLPMTLALRDPADKSNAALVLDYLAHNGYDSTLRLIRKSMVERRWLASSTTTLSSPISAPTSQSVPSDIADFTSLTAALIYLRSRIVHANTAPIPWALIHSLDPLGSLRTDPLSHRLEIHGFIHLLIQADHLPEIEAEVVDEKAIDLGKTLLGRSKEESWLDEDRSMLDQAFGLIGIPVAEWNTGPGSVAGEERRSVDADALVMKIRSQLLPT